MNKSTILVAGATGLLGGKIVRALIERKAGVRVIVRHDTSAEKLAALLKLGVEIKQVDYKNEQEMVQACSNIECVVSALSGLHDVMINTQGALLDAAIKAGVPRFIPSDYSLDFTKTPAGRNRNLDVRREFHERLDKAPIKTTSIFNGAFTNLLTGEAPFILVKLQRILCWGDANQTLDFTTMDDTAAFTASAALDPLAPRKLHIAGDRLSSRELAEVVSAITGKKFSTLRAGSLKMLSLVINLTRVIMPAKNELYPPWQGMQYMRDMFSGLAKVEPLDNNRYAEIKWQTVREFLAK